MTRCTPQEVKCVKPSSLDDSAVWPFIQAATVAVDRVSGCDDFSDAELKQIEIFYAAHLLNIQDPDLVEEKVEGFTNKFARGRASMGGVMGSQYGQTANTLARGCLAELDKPRAFYVTPC